MEKETARRLAELRSSHGDTQDSLAKKLGLSRQSISKWERAEASPDIDNLIALAKLYGVSVDGILGLLPAKEAAPTEEAPEPPEKIPDPEKRPDFPGTVDLPDPDGNKDPLQEHPIETPEPTPEPGEERVTEVPPITVPETPSIRPDDPDVVRAGAPDESEQDPGSAAEAVHTPEPEPAVPGDNEAESDAPAAHDAPAGKTSARSALHPFHLLPVGLIALGTFCTVGLLTGRWHPAWILLFLFPLYHSLVESVLRREPLFFLFPLLPLAVYLWLGFTRGAWLVSLAVFFTVPVYYALCLFFSRLRHETPR